MLAAADSAHHALPPPSDQSSLQEILEYYTWKSPMPRLLNGLTITRLNASRDLEPRAVLHQQARQRVPNGDASSLARWGLEPFESLPDV